MQTPTEFLSDVATAVINADPDRIKSMGFYMIEDGKHIFVALHGNMGNAVNGVAEMGDFLKKAIELKATSLASQATVIEAPRDDA